MTIEIDGAHDLQRLQFLPALAALVLGCCMVAPARAASGVPEAAHEWQFLEGRNGEYREVLTVVGALPPQDLRTRFHVLLRFVWCYASLADGMPDDEEMVRGRELYAALDRIIGQAGVYAMTRTGAGERTVYYYVEDATALTPGIAGYFDALPSINVEVIAREEPGWDTVKRVLDHVR